MDTTPDKYRPAEELISFLTVAKILILHPYMDTLDRLHVVEWLVPSYFISNGHFIDSHAREWIEELLELHTPTMYSSRNMWMILGLLHWIELNVPSNAQELLLQWLKEYNEQKLLTLIVLGDSP